MNHKSWLLTKFPKKKKKVSFLFAWGYILMSFLVLNNFQEHIENILAIPLHTQRSMQMKMVQKSL